MLNFNQYYYKQLIQERGKKYIKTSTTKVKKIDMEIFDSHQGFLNTREGIVPMKVGDYLASDGEMSYIISQKAFEINKEIIGDEDGWLLVKSKNHIWACEMDDDFEVEVRGVIQHGKKNDYLIHNGFTFWPIDKNIFERDYESII